MIRDDNTKVIQFVKNPAKIALAIVRDHKDKDNAITLEWFMRTSIEPPMFAISVGTERYSHQCLLHYRYFNLCFPAPEQIEAVKICGSLSGRDTDKIALCNFASFPGKLAKLPIILNAAANFECDVISQLRSGDHTIFTGQVKYSWFDQSKRVITYDDF